MTNNISGHWDLVIDTPIGRQEHLLTIIQNGETFTGEAANEFWSFPVDKGHIEGDKMHWCHKLAVPLPMTVEAVAVVDGDTMSGTMSAGPLANARITAHRKA